MFHYCCESQRRDEEVRQRQKNRGTDQILLDYIKPIDMCVRYSSERYKLLQGRTTTTRALIAKQAVKMFMPEISGCQSSSNIGLLLLGCIFLYLLLLEFIDK
ncbi:hypothetical protein GQX74_015562 [Glossina fuscipes]|nr:hypothetical protein GQX74_015562 [Glossina fuscipes]